MKAGIPLVPASVLLTDVPNLAPFLTHSTKV
jgi:hypothetical protein